MFASIIFHKFACYTFRTYFPPFSCDYSIVNVLIWFNMLVNLSISFVKFVRNPFLFKIDVNCFGWISLIRTVSNIMKYGWWSGNNYVSKYSSLFGKLKHNDFVQNTNNRILSENNSTHWTNEKFWRRYRSVAPHLLTQYMCDLFDSKYRCFLIGIACLATHTAKTNINLCILNSLLWHQTSYGHIGPIAGTLHNLKKC